MTRQFFRMIEGLAVQWHDEGTPSPDKDGHLCPTYEHTGMGSRHKWRDKPVEEPVKAVDPLFKSRVPEAAARQMAAVLMNLLECQFATLEGFTTRTSKSERARQQAICDTHLRQLVELDISPDTTGLRGSSCPRVRKAMIEFRTKEKDD